MTTQSRPALSSFVARACVAILALVGLTVSAAAQPIATAARLGQHEDRTRFVVELTDEVGYRLFTLTDPYRIVVEMPAVEWRVSRTTGAKGSGLVRAYRFGPFGAEKSRIVLDLRKPAQVRTHFLIPPEAGRPARLVLDLAPQDEADFAAAAGWPEDLAAAPRSKPSLGAPSDDRLAGADDGRFVVAIDPGHGGKDAGATGVSGVLEKDIVLAVALALKKELEGRGGYEVVLTREDDTFLSLKERVRVARDAKADLFISVHADSVGRPGVRGASVYTLSEKASDKEAEALAQAENDADVIAGVDLSGETDEVTGILIDLAQRETKNRSVVFAQILMPQLRRQTNLLPETHRFAGFRVLKAPDVPSVLLELGFLSNSEDESDLMSAGFQKGMARSIAEAVDAYRDRVTAVADGSAR